MTRAALLGCLALTALALLGAQIALHRTPALQALSINDNDDTALSALLQRRPFDAAVHLAIAGRGASANETPSAGAALALRSANMLAPNDPDVLRLSVFRAIQAGHYEKAIMLAERLAEVDPNAQADALAAIVALRGDAAWQRTIDRWAEAKSPLLGTLAATACRSAIPLADKLYVATRASAIRQLTLSSLECLREVSAASPEYQSVYTLWLDRIAAQRASSEFSVPYVFNGDFSMAIEGEPFDWRLGRGGEFRDGFTVRVKRGGVPATNRYLEVELNGRPVKSELASIAIALPSGTYALSYKLRDTTATANGRFRLSLRCHNGIELTPAQSENGTLDPSAEWSTLRTRFTVPSGCFSQRLALDSTRPNWRTLGLTGRVSLDDVVIESLAQ